MLTHVKLYTTISHLNDKLNMSDSLRIYLGLLVVVLIGWIYWRTPALINLDQNITWAKLLFIMALYLCSHLLRIFRLLLLTLDDRTKAVSIIMAHSLTALPSSFLPFKLGEIFRLTAFFRVFDSPEKTIAVWLIERFGDIIVIVIFILFLYFFHINVPPKMRIILIVFIFFFTMGLLSLIAIANVFLYLNRRLVLASISSKGLKLLRLSYRLRRLETTIYETVEGRVSGLLFLSILIWTFEILALSIFINQVANETLDFSQLFGSSLLESLSGNSSIIFGMYQSLTLILMTILFIAILSITGRLKTVKI